MLENFPHHSDAPLEIQVLDGNCGVLTAWGVLKHFRKRTSARNLIETCGFSRAGIYMIGLAVCFRKHGLNVEFVSEPDPFKTSVEKRFYTQAEKIGVEFRDAIGVDILLAELTRGRIPIVLYDTSNGEGHITPVLGAENSKLIVPYTDEGTIGLRDFLKGWKTPKILRQALLVWR